MVIYGDNKVSIHLFKSTESKQQMTGHLDDVTAIIAKNDHEIISSSFDGSIRVWNINSGRLLKIYDIYF